MSYDVLLVAPSAAAADALVTEAAGGAVWGTAIVGVTAQRITSQTVAGALVEVTVPDASYRTLQGAWPASSAGWCVLLQGVDVTGEYPRCRGRSGPMPSEEFLLRNWLRSECARHGYAWFTGGKSGKPYDLNIVAVRVLPGTVNAFDDWMTCSFLDDYGEWITEAWPITTDPGLYWLENPGRTSGTGILRPGQYRDSHRIGKHKSRYPALVQTGGPVTLIRDANKDDVLDYDAAKQESGYFGVNIHASDSNPFDAQDPNPAHLVNRWSAACQVFADSADYREWWGIVLRGAAVWGDRFTLTLLTSEGDPPGLG